MNFDLVKNVMENAMENSDARNLEKYNARSAIFSHRVFHHVHQIKTHRFSRTVTSGLRGRPGRHPGSRPEEVLGSLRGEAPADASGGLSTGETCEEEPMACGDAAGEARVKASHKHPSLQGAVPEAAALSL